MQTTELKQQICILMVLMHRVIYKLTWSDCMPLRRGWVGCWRTCLSVLFFALPYLTTSIKVLSTLLVMDEKSTHVKLASHVEFCFSHWNYGGLASTLFLRKISKIKLEVGNKYFTYLLAHWSLFKEPMYAVIMLRMAGKRPENQQMTQVTLESRLIWKNLQAREHF